MPEVNIALNSAGIAYLNAILAATDYRVIFGGSSQTLSGSPNNQYIWGNSGGTGLGVTLTLQISPIPLPASLPLMLAGMAGLGWVATTSTN